MEPEAINTSEAQLHAERAIAIAAGLFEQAGRKSTPIGLWYPQRSIRLDPLAGRAQSGRAIRSLALLDLEESAQPLIPVPVRTRDRVVLIQRGSRIPNEIPAMRVLNTDHPDTWLSASQSLPESLRGVE